MERTNSGRMPENRCVCVEREARGWVLKDSAPQSFSWWQIQAVFTSFDLPLAERAAQQFRAYLDLLLLWNRRISLTAVETPEEIVQKHFIESVLATKVLANIHGRLADVGTGAGFPGIPLKIYIPEIHLTLIEPNTKKSAFLAEVVRSLGLEAVEIIQRRYEDVRRPAAPFDVVTARALGQFVDFLEWVETVIMPDGRVVVWTGPDGKIELERRKSWKWSVPYTIPRSKHRLILSGAR